MSTKSNKNNKQSSLDSFFGGGATTKQPQQSSNKGGAKQKTIASFFTKNTSSSSSSSSSTAATTTAGADASLKSTTSRNDSDVITSNTTTISSTHPISPTEISTDSSLSTTTKVSNVNHSNTKDNDDDDDDDIKAKQPEKNRQNHHHERKAKRRRVIIDDDDDEDDDGIVNNAPEQQPQTEKEEAEPPKIPSVGRKKIHDNIEDDEQDMPMKDETIRVSRNNENNKEKSNPTNFSTAIRTKKINQMNKETKVKNSCASDEKKKMSKKNEIPVGPIETVDMERSTTAATITKKSSNAHERDDPTTATATKNSNATISTTGKGNFKSDQEVMSESPSWNNDTSDTSPTPIPYSRICTTFAQIEAITSRLQIQDLLTTLLRQILLYYTCSSTSSSTNTSPKIVQYLQKDLQAVLYLASNTVAPAYECIELGVGDALLMKAIGQATGTNTNMIKQKYEALGDLGTVAQTYKGKQSTLGGFFTKSTPTSSTKNSNKNALLSAQEVWSAFQQIAQTKGNHSQQWKVDIIKKLLVRTSDPIETKYIIRGLQGKLRIGLSQATVLIAFAHAFTLTKPTSILPKKSSIVIDDDDENNPEEVRQYMDRSQPIDKVLEAANAIVKRAYSEVPSYDAIIDAALKVPLQHFYQVCTLTPGIPVTPMLAKPTKSVQEVLKRLNGLKFTCEYKYDGERAQIHMLSNGTTKVFSRNLLDTSEKYPEVPIFVKEACDTSLMKDGASQKIDSAAVTSFVLDAEVVAWNSKTEQFVPFQILSTRKKTEESAETAKVQVIVQAFDLMYLNGQSLLHHTLSDRRALLHKYFHPVPGKFQFAQYLDHMENGDTIVLEEFLENAVKAQCEGLMVKTLDVNAIYEPSRRSLNWLKLKKDYLEGLGDSVDLVPLGAYHGRGKRTGVYGAYLLACYDPDTEEYQSVCKIGTGFSDENLRTLSEQLNKHIMPTKSSQYKVSDQLECDVWFDAVQVWEVKAADLSKSSTHRGAEGKTGEAGRGIGLRFPRFERVRDDKRPDSATTSDQILEMYYQQDSIIDNGLNDDADDDDGI